MQSSQKSDEETRNQWHAILDLSQTMLDLAGKRDWARLDELATRQQDALEEFFTETSPEWLQANTTLLQQDIKLIQQIDTDIIELTRSNQDSLSTELQRLRTGKSMISQYKKNC